MIVPERPLLKLEAFHCTVKEKVNRFVVRASVGEEELLVHNTNTGRLEDLIWEGNEAYCSPKGGGKLKYKLVAAKTPFGFAVTDTNLQERALERAFELGYLSWARGCEVKRRPRYGSSTFDFELRCPEGRALVEAKSADLASWRGFGMWPDCPTDRGVRHLEELGAFEGRKVVVFVVGFPKASGFVPYCKGDPRVCELLAKLDLELRAVGMYFEPLTSSVVLYAELPALLLEGREEPLPKVVA
ncbi:DNA/RNA nuclease SfsA [Ignicoccus hospitalis]|uniref:Sugar fermentation stimulation protein n=1 Tax=Ignicoccus hospitalis (strain KIN4/I / DSM 18386 / JCM 14125) TaxID=453591 RepID=A8A9D5_IGNH4|nr:DNA/RNA nuclease SfsA [Ignicoccus hospitalis]ABU81537.1 sugar fermentation stimulation protein [Ignicoccus hospitalis KIN4/I]HIH90472.1 DNA/RNA nuclease SfsA [Desulfurococcaceae archaeon]